jgi:hypothetical protein
MDIVDEMDEVDGEQAFNVQGSTFKVQSGCGGQRLYY